MHNYTHSAVRRFKLPTHSLACRLFILLINRNFPILQSPSLFECALHQLSGRYARHSHCVWLICLLLIFNMSIHIFIYKCRCFHVCVSIQITCTIPVSHARDPCEDNLCPRQTGATKCLGWCSSTRLKHLVSHLASFTVTRLFSSLRPHT